MALLRPAEMPRLKAPEADLRRGYGRALSACFGISLTTFVLLMVLFPTFEAKAYSRPQAPIVIQLENIPETHQERRPPPPPRPVMPVASESHDVPDDATIMETDLDFAVWGRIPESILRSTRASLVGCGLLLAFHDGFRLGCRKMISLDQFGCLCSTMFRVSPNHLLWVLEGLVKGEVHNRIVVPDEQKAWTRVALDRMLSIR